MDDDRLRAAVEANLYRAQTVWFRVDEQTGDLEAVYREAEGDAPVMEIRGTFVRYDPETGDILSVRFPRSPDVDAAL